MAFFRDIKTALTNLKKNKITTSATIISSSATLFILSIVLIIILNVNNFVINSKEKFYNVQVYFNNSASFEQIMNIKKTLENKNNFKSITYKSKSDSMDDFKAKFGSDSNLFDNIDNPLSDSLIVEINDFSDIKTIENSLKSNELVESIEYFKDELTALEKLSKVVSLTGLGIIALLFIITLLVLINTIKIAVFSRMKEINIMRYVGATNWYIRRPFIYEGIFLGLSSAFFAGLFSILIYGQIYQKLYAKGANAALKNIIIPSQGISFLLIRLLFITGIGVGSCGAMISMRRYLKV